jgi:response regulator NasT
MDKARLLLVDDDLLVLAALSKGLADHGYPVVTAESGEAALRLAQDQTFDLAVLDMRMKRLSGTATARRLLQDHGLHAIFLTAYTDQLEQAVDEGALGYLVKPVDVKQLIPAIEAAVARARDLHALEADRANLKSALSGSRQISMAIGVLIERRGIGEQEAFELLRAQARHQRRTVDEVAREVVEGILRLNQL